MADAICRWRNGTPKTVVELVNSLPHEKMPIDAFRNSMSNKWNGDFFRTAYQLACQLALYCESEDGYSFGYQGTIFQTLIQEKMGFKRLSALHSF